MMRGFFIAIITCVFVHGPYTRHFIDRYTDSTVFAGYLAIPVPEERFVLLDNGVVQGRLYYDHHFNEYSSYHSFLDALLNHPGSINILEDIGITHTEREDAKLQQMARQNKLRFQRKYLAQVVQGEDVFEVKRRYKKKEYQVLKACFDIGLYVYWNDVAASWVISENPIHIPSIED